MDHAIILQVKKLEEHFRDGDFRESGKLKRSNFEKVYYICIYICI